MVNRNDHNILFVFIVYYGCFEHIISIEIAQDASDVDRTKPREWKYRDGHC